MLIINLLLVLSSFLFSLLYITFGYSLFGIITSCLILISIIFNRTKFFYILKVFSFTLFLTLPLGIMNYLFSNSKSPPLIQDIAITIVLPFFLLTFSSLIVTKNLNFFELILYLMSKKILKPRIGYILIIAVESIAEISEEWERIRMVGENRKIKGKKRIYFIFSLFVFSIRLSYRKSLSLLSRGVSDDKLFYQLPLDG